MEPLDKRIGQAMRTLNPFLEKEKEASAAIYGLSSNTSILLGFMTGVIDEGSEINAAGALVSIICGAYHIASLMDMPLEQMVEENVVLLEKIVSDKMNELMSKSQESKIG